MDINIFELIRIWGRGKGLNDAKSQYLKLGEENGEISRAMTKGDMRELAMEIGDAVVVLTNLAMIYGIDIEDCITAAYTKISKRKGETVDGIFIKAAEYPEMLDDTTDEYMPRPTDRERP